MVGSRRKREKLCSILLTKKGKGANKNVKNGVGNEVKGYRKWEVWTPCPPNYKVALKSSYQATHCKDLSTHFNFFLAFTVSLIVEQMF